MGHVLAHIYSLPYWRPKYWKALNLKRYLWRTVHESYDEMIREGKNLESLLSKNKPDEYIVERAFHIYIIVSSAWYGIDICRESFDTIKYQNIRLTPEEKAIYEQYYRVGYLVFYKCRELFLDARVIAGKITREKRDEQMREIEQKFYKKSTIIRFF